MKGIFDLIKDYGQDLKNALDLRSVKYVVHCWRTIHMGVFASYFCYNKLPQAQLLKTTEVYYYLGSQKSWNQCVDGCVPSGSFRWETISLPFPASRGLPALVCGPFLHFQNIAFSNLSLTLDFLASIVPFPLILTLLTFSLKTLLAH